MNGTLTRGTAVLRVFDSGEGIPIVFQHGLGGDQAQVSRNLRQDAGYRYLTVECRGQGGSSAGDERPFTIAMFTDDVLAAIDQAGIGRFVIGGISMGAAIALRIAARDTANRVAGLALVRPAWLFDHAPRGMRPYAEVARALQTEAPRDARASFSRSAAGRALAEEAPENFVTLLGFFDRPDPFVTAALLEDIAMDGPGVTRAMAAAITAPTLVLGGAEDYIHPLSYAETLATVIGGSFIEVAAKAAEPTRHFAEVGDALAEFFDTLDI